MSKKGHDDTLKPDPANGSEEVDLERFWAAQRSVESKPKLSDEELLRVLLSDARHDYLNGWGRIFVDEFLKRWNCTREHIYEVLKANNVKFHWDFHQGGNVLLINC